MSEGNRLRDGLEVILVKLDGEITTSANLANQGMLDGVRKAEKRIEKIEESLKAFISENYVAKEDVQKIIEKAGQEVEEQHCFERGYCMLEGKLDELIK